MRNDLSWRRMIDGEEQVVDTGVRAYHVRQYHNTCLPSTFCCFYGCQTPSRPLTHRIQSFEGLVSMWSEVKWSDIRPSMVTHTRNLCSAFNPSNVHTHSSEHTHTVNTHTPWTHTRSNVCIDSREPFLHVTECATFTLRLNPGYNVTFCEVNKVLVTLTQWLSCGLKPSGGEL